MYHLHRSGPSVVYQGSAVILGETRIDAADAGFRREAVADVWPSIAFPRVPLGIHAADGPPVLGDANTAILFSVGRPYRRISIDGCGSWTEWIEIRPDVLVEMVAALAPGAAPGASSPFVTGSAPAPERLHLAHRRARRLLASSGIVDELALEETALAIAGEVLRAGYAVSGVGRKTTGDRVRSRRELVFDVQSLLNRRLGHPLSLADISDALNVSPFHLCRVFRDVTGVPIHRYRDRLRLHASLELIADRDVPVLQIALELGYSNEAHFSEAFRRAFGMRPGAYRRSVPAAGRFL